MPTVNKVFLIPAILVLALTCIWLSGSVLEARKQWDKKVKQKAEEVAKVSKEIDELQFGGENFSEEFFKAVVEPILPLSTTARNEYADKTKAGFDSRVSFESAMNHFVDPKVVATLQAAVRRLNEVQSKTLPDNIELDSAQEAYGAALTDMKATMSKLEEAYAIFLGQSGTTGGIRTMAGPGKGMNIDSIRDTVVHIRQIISSQRSIFNTMYSDGQKNSTRLSDLLVEAVAEGNIMQKSAANGQRELEDRTKEKEQLTTDLNLELMEQAKEEEKRDKAVQELADLRDRFKALTGKAIALVQSVKEKEIRIDSLRDFKVVVSPDGSRTTGNVLDVNDGDSTLRIDMGINHGVKPGVQLHVYRLSPEAKYLGLMEVLKSESDGAMGRMLPEYRQLTIRTGDKVGAEISLDDADSKKKPKTQ